MADIPTTLKGIENIAVPVLQPDGTAQDTPLSEFAGVHADAEEVSGIVLATSRLGRLSVATTGIRRVDTPYRWRIEPGVSPTFELTVFAARQLRDMGLGRPPVFRLRPYLRRTQATRKKPQEIILVHPYAISLDKDRRRNPHSPWRFNTIPRVLNGDRAKPGFIYELVQALERSPTPHPS